MKLNQTIDAEQLAEWIDLYQDQLFRYAFFRIGSKEDAEDVVQDAFLKIAATTAHIANPRAYLFRMVGNGCVDVIRNKVKFSPIEERMTTPSPSDEREKQEEFERINRLLSNLPEQQSEVIRLHIHANLKFTEIADILEQPVTTIKSRFASGIEKLRKQFIN